MHKIHLEIEDMEQLFEVQHSHQQMVHISNHQQVETELNFQATFTHEHNLQLVFGVKDLIQQKNLEHFQIGELITEDYYSDCNQIQQLIYYFETKIINNQIGQV
jgi:hypothetical protein